MDTGGLFGATTDPLHTLVVEHGLKALATADLVVLVVDAKDGLVPGDQEIARRVHGLGRPVILAVNKTDDKKAQARAVEFHALGFETMMEISAEHGDGVAELLDEVNKRPLRTMDGEEAKEPRPWSPLSAPECRQSSLVN